MTFQIPINIAQWIADNIILSGAIGFFIFSSLIYWGWELIRKLFRKKEKPQKVAIPKTLVPEVSSPQVSMALDEDDYLDLTKNG